VPPVAAPSAAVPASGPPSAERAPAVPVVPVVLVDAGPGVSIVGGGHSRAVFQIHLFAQDVAGVSTRVRPVYEILRAASAVEPEMAKIHAEMDGYRLKNMSRFATWLASRGALRVDAERAGEIVWALASPDVGRMLCDRRGWSQHEYADWLEDVLVRTLLPGE
jgi:hypothetical protein